MPDVNDHQGAGVSTPGPLLALRTDPRVRAVVLRLDLRNDAFALVTCFVTGSGRRRGEIGDYLAPLLLHHFRIVGQPGPPT